jgi:uncharacterized membrane protein YgaE (UPF0421/DUF939 family)
MSDLDDKQPEMAEMLNKMTRYNKNVKALMELMNKALEKLDILVKNKSSNYNDDDAEKERMDKIFEAKKIGRPVGTFETKQQQYLKMLNEGRVKQPKSQTLEFYKIEKDGEVFKVMGE